MKKSILTTLSVLATALLIISPITHAITSEQKHEQAAINDNNIVTSLSDPANNDLTSTENDDNDQNNNDDDADSGDSSSNSDDGND